MLQIRPAAALPSVLALVYAVCCLFVEEMVVAIRVSDRSS